MQWNFVKSKLVWISSEIIGMNIGMRLWPISRTSNIARMRYWSSSIVFGINIEARMTTFRVWERGWSILTSIYMIVLVYLVLLLYFLLTCYPDMQLSVMVLFLFISTMYRLEHCPEIMYISFPFWYVPPPYSHKVRSE